MCQNSNEVWMQIIKDADTNGDGQIDFAEFMKMMYDTNQKV